MIDSGRLRSTLKKIIPGARILLYHRVAAVENDPQLLCVTPGHFAEQMEVLRKYYEVVDLEELVSTKYSLFRKRKLFAVTFDDGYVDNLYQAKPILRMNAIHATVFVVAGQVGLKQELWWDELARVFLVSESIPERLALAVNGQHYTWEFEDHQRLNREILYWNVLNPKTTSVRQSAYLQINDLIRGCNSSMKKSVLGYLREWAGLGNEGRADYRVMNADELRNLVQDDLIKVGSHTMTHSLLSATNGEGVFYEINESKMILENILSKKITGFSYPFGGKLDYTKKTIRELKAYGFEWACSNFPGRVIFKTDSFQLPRYLVRDWDGNVFHQYLEKW